MPFSGPVVSAFISWKPPTPRSGIRATVKAIIPIPPSQWVSVLQTFIDFGSDSTSSKIEKPVVEKPAAIEKNYVGGRLKEYDSIVVLSHFKGHQMGGFGGALKQLSIGFASQKGKTYIHTAGKYTDWQYAMSRAANQENFTASMADAASTIVDYFKGKIAFITVLANISLACDCAGASAPAPKIHDIGILASTDPVAIDKAGLDLIKQNVDTGTDALLSQINRLKGENTVEVADKMGFGTMDYNLINVDSENPEDSDDSEEPVIPGNAGSIVNISIQFILFILFLL